jgi:cytoskeletal protein RodZ
MTDQFAFLGDKCKAAIAAMSLGVLLLLPASLGFGGTIIEEAYGQFNLPLLEEEPDTGEDTGTTTTEDTGTTTTEDTGTTTTEDTGTTTTPTTPTTNTQDLSTYMMADMNTDPVRGYIGSSLATQGAGGDTLTAADDSGHIVTGAFRMFANESLVRRFVARMELAAIDGSSFHNVTFTEGTPHRFEVTEGNGTTAASSSIIGSIFIDGSPTPVIDSVPMTLAIRGQVLTIEGIDVGEARRKDTGQRDTISLLDGQTIYGTIPRG